MNDLYEILELLIKTLVYFSFGIFFYFYPHYIKYNIKYIRFKNTLIFYLYKCKYILNFLLDCKNVLIKPSKFYYIYKIYSFHEEAKIIIYNDLLYNNAIKMKHSYSTLNKDKIKKIDKIINIRDTTARYSNILELHFRYYGYESILFMAQMPFSFYNDVIQIFPEELRYSDSNIMYIYLQIELSEISDKIMSTILSSILKHQNVLFFFLNGVTITNKYSNKNIIMVEFYIGIYKSLRYFLYSAFKKKNIDSLLYSLINIVKNDCIYINNIYFKTYFLFNDLLTFLSGSLLLYTYPLHFFIFNSIGSNFFINYINYNEYWYPIYILGNYYQKNNRSVVSIFFFKDYIKKYYNIGSFCHNYLSIILPNIFFIDNENTLIFFNNKINIYSFLNDW